MKYMIMMFGSAAGMIRAGGAGSLKTGRAGGMDITGASISLRTSWIADSCQPAFRTAASKSSFLYPFFAWVFMYSSSC